MPIAAGTPTVTSTVPRVTGTFLEYQVPGAPLLSNICLGPDNNLWFSTESTVYLGRCTHAGDITLYTLPQSGNLGGICVGPDGLIWFTEFTNNKVSKLDPNSPDPKNPILTRYALTGGAGPGGIVNDGTNLWIIEATAQKITKVDTSGTQTRYTPGTLLHGPGLGVGAGAGFVYSCAQSIGEIYKTAISTGVSTSLGVTPAGATSTPYTIVEGPDGNLWFTEFANIATVGKVGKVTHAGAYTEYTIPTASPTMGGIASGPDGNLWATEKTGNKIARITTAGVITEYTIPTSASNPDKICATGDKRLAFTEHDTGKIGFISV